MLSILSSVEGRSMRLRSADSWKKESLRPTSKTPVAMPWVYILKCRDNSYYTGSAMVLEIRLAEHEDGTYGGYTACRRPTQLVFSQETSTMHEAFILERQIKGWSRAKKEAIISGDYQLLPKLSRCRSRSRKVSASPAASFDEAQDAGLCDPQDAGCDPKDAGLCDPQIRD